jgi:hypothetical protein
MTVNAAAVTVGTTPTRLTSDDRADSPDGQTVVIYNNGAAPLYVGASDVTTTDGFPVEYGQSRSFPLAAGEELYGIAEAGLAVRVLRTGIA